MGDLAENGTGQMASTGVDGLDDILTGGFARRRLYLVEGAPGSGKTTLALQFLMAGAARGEVVMYVTLSETGEELTAGARSHGWSLDGIDVRELVPSEEALTPGDQNTMFHPSEVELTSTLQPILADVERLKPARVVFDSLSEVRLLAGNPLRYRRQILALKQFFATRQCTVVLLDDLTTTAHDVQMGSLAHGVLSLEHLSSQYGAERRRLRVVKYRGVKFRGGFHDYVIEKGGVRVFPRLVAAEHRHESVRGRLSSGVEGLDAAIGGGLAEGTSTLIMGAAGTGKSTLAAQFAAAAAGRGQRSLIVVFDETPQTLVSRCEALGIPLAGHLGRGLVELRQIDPAELTPGEFVQSIRAAVEQREARLVVLDSLNGYLNAMPEERFLIIQLHELLMYLSQRNVSTILVSAQQGIVGVQLSSPVDASYLADTVLLIRHFEADGELRQAISVTKKRDSAHDRSIREFRVENGIRVGEVLRSYRGVLTGLPVQNGVQQP